MVSLCWGGWEELKPPLSRHSLSLSLCGQVRAGGVPAAAIFLSGSRWLPRSGWRRLCSAGAAHTHTHRGEATASGGNFLLGCERASEDEEVPCSNGRRVNARASPACRRRLSSSAAGQGGHEEPARLEQPSWASPPKVSEASERQGTRPAGHKDAVSCRCRFGFCLLPGCFFQRCGQASPLP